MKGSLRSKGAPVVEEEIVALERIYRDAREALAGIQPGPDAGFEKRMVKVNFWRELESFVQTHPDSSWVPDLSLKIGLAARERANYSAAIFYLSKAWSEVKETQEQPGLDIGREALGPLMRLLVLTGRLDDVDALLAEAQEQGKVPPSSEWTTALEQARYNRMHPAAAYKCGLYSLDQLGRLTQMGEYHYDDIVERDATPAGYSMAELLEIGEQVGLRVRGIFVEELSEFPVPCVVHLKSEHYVVVREKRGKFYNVMDPLVYGPKWLTATELAEDASGGLIVSEVSEASDELGARMEALDASVAKVMRGRCHPIEPQDGKDYGPCDEEGGEGECPTCRPGQAGGSGPGSGGSPGECGSCGDGGKTHSGFGMPGWVVTEPFLTLWLVDTPLEYKPAYGPSLRLKIVHSERFGGSPMFEESFEGAYVGMQWRCSLLSFLQVDDSGNYVQVFLPASGWAMYEFPDLGNVSQIDYHSNTWIEKMYSGGVLTGCRLYYRDGSYVDYTHEYGNVFYMEKQYDQAGNYSTYSYYANILTNVTAADGVSFTLEYDSAYHTNLITGVTTSYGASVTFTHGEYRTNTYNWYTDQLTTITDAAGISSQVNYTGDGTKIGNITTPYGMTSFSTTSEGRFYRSVRITLPNGAQEFYGNLPDYWWLSDWPDYASSQIPTNTPVNTLDWDTRVERNTLYWNAKQFESIKNADPWYFDWDDFKKARIRHWLASTEEYYSDFHTLGQEQAPSPDGTTEGAVLWYDYAGKPYPTEQGTQVLPSVIAQVRPDGSTWYEYYTRNDLGFATQKIEKWNVGSTEYYRTNSFGYDSDNNLLWQVGPEGHTEARYSYSGSHPGLPERFTNAVNEVTIYTYDSAHRLKTTQFPSGLLSSNTYSGSSGFLEKTVDWVSGSPLRTNSYTWENGLVKTHTDERGLTVTNYWDGLRRLTGIDYPDGSYMQNVYHLFPGQSYASSTGGTNILDVTASRDRLGNWTYFEYNNMRQLARVIDPMTNITAYGYCDCGVLEAVTNALGTSAEIVTQHTYDHQGKRLVTMGPGGMNRTNSYDLIGRLVRVGDAAGLTTNVYDNLGRLVAQENAAGKVFELTFDDEDRVTMRVDANGVETTMTYDDLGRLRTRAVSSGGTEAFGYTANVAGPTSYTNGVGKVTWYGYHAAGWKTSEVQAGMSTNEFSYSGAGDLLVLSDGKGKLTEWGYDEYGRVTSKTNDSGTKILSYLYDANGRLTNRWSAAKGNTYYAYDGVGNLTNIHYPSSTDISYSYDGLNRMSSMVDAVGTTTWTHDPANRFSVEDGPWANDNVTNRWNTAGSRESMAIQQPTSYFNTTYAYDAAKRFTNITSGAGTYRYVYHPGLNSHDAASRLVMMLALPNSSFIDNYHDSAGRLTGTYLMKSDTVTVLNYHNYVYNDANQRTKQTITGGIYWDYLYDDAGQLYSAQGYNVLGGLIPSYTRGYAYDPAWNMTSRTNYTTPLTYMVNNLNQVTNSPAGAHTFDSNGNMTAEAPGTSSARHFTYDDENQLKEVIKYSSFSPSTKAEFVYDGKMRLRITREFTYYSGDWLAAGETRYVYDGMLVVQDRDGSNVPTVTYTRGPDLSGTLQGAGGIGGLLGRSHDYSSVTGAWATHHHYHADGNGNVTYLVNASQGTAALYRYDPFGNTLAAIGTLASTNHYRFSSKLIHPNSGLYYYGYRFYNPSLQRWVNADPITDNGFQKVSQVDFPFVYSEEPNLYRFLKNTPPNQIDSFGNASWGWPVIPPPGAPPTLPPNCLPAYLCNPPGCTYHKCVSCCLFIFNKKVEDACGKLPNVYARIACFGAVRLARAACTDSCSSCAP